MTEQDEETKEHPVYPEPANPTTPDTGMPGANTPPAAFPGDPLGSTTIGTIPPAPAGMAPINPGMPPARPAYPQPSGSAWPGQSYPAQQQGQWQQPGYGQAGYPAQQWSGAPTYSTSVLVALAGLVLIIFGVALAALGGWTLTLGNDLAHFIRDNDIAIFGRQIDRDTLKSVLQPMPGILMVLGVLELLVGAVILAHRSWARWLGTLLALLGLVVSVIVLSSVLALVPGTSVQLVVAITLLIGYAFVVLALVSGGGHFRKRYPGR